MAKRDKEDDEREEDDRPWTEEQWEASQELWGAFVDSFTAP